VDEAIACYHKAIALDPKHAGAHSNLGVALKAKGQMDEAIVCFGKAIVLDPKSATAHRNLGDALYGKGELDEAIVCFKKSIELDSKLAAVHSNLGAALQAKGRVDEAMACYQKAIALDPKYAMAHMNLGNVLAGKGKDDEAIAYFRKAIALDSKLATAHYNLGIALDRKGRVDEAIASWRKATLLDPKLANAHYSLGNALRDKGRAEEAIACYQRAIEADPNSAEAHCNLGGVLKSQGRFAESLAAFQRGHKLGMKRPGWPFPSAQWVREAERLAALEGKLSAFLKGELTPENTGEYLVLVAICQDKKLHRAASRLYAAAFAAEPKLADDPLVPHRYNAACHAALAAAGQGADAGTLDGSQRQALRRQALTWLRAELALWTRLFASDEVGRSRLVRVVTHWQKDSDLAGLRDKVALAKLSAEERAACAKLWADVAALLKKSQTPTQKEGK
jgi:tetratricopeptide (TPR) repeat protein